MTDSAKSRPRRLGLATGLAMGIAWVICVIFVALVPGPTLALFGWMLHFDLSPFVWALDVTGVIVGGLAWVVFSGLFVWLTAAIYEALR